MELGQCGGVVVDLGGTRIQLIACAAGIPDLGMACIAHPCLPVE